VLINGLYLGYCLLFAEDKTAALLLGLYTLSVVFDINWFFFGMENFKHTTIRNFAIKLVKTVLIFLFVKGKGAAYLYCLIMAAGFLVSQLALWPSALKTVKFYVPTFKEIIVHLKPNLLLFGTTIAVTMFKVMDKIMLGNMASVEQVGFYESSEIVLMVPVALISALGTVMLPRMTNLLSKNSEEAKDVLHLSILFAMFVSSAMSFGIMGVAREFVPIFYGEGYDICVYLYLILLPSCIFLAFANVIRTQYLLPQQMDRAYVVSAILGAVTNLCINAILIIPLGAIGAAIGTLAAEGVVCAYQSKKVMQKISITRYIYEAVPLVLSGAIMFAVLYFWNNLPVAPFVALIIKIVAGVVIYFVALFLLSLVFRINYINVIKKTLKKQK